MVLVRNLCLTHACRHACLSASPFVTVRRGIGSHVCQLFYVCLSDCLRVCGVCVCVCVFSGVLVGGCVCVCVCVCVCKEMCMCDCVTVIRTRRQREREREREKGFRA